ncbi:MAG TPA: AAA family ATPase [bacterium]|nr:AAA family ATPase [bacterium]
MRKIAVINQKGGSGKTTTVVNTGVVLARTGRKVLLIDLDPQAHTTIHLGLEPPSVNNSAYEVLVGKLPIQQALATTQEKGLFLLPSKIELASAEIELVTTVGREAVLRDALKNLRQHFDYIIVDCPPSLGLLTLNALTAMREVLIPIQAEFFALEGLTKLLQTIEIVQQRINRDLAITGVLITMYDERKNICRDVARKVKEHFKDKVFRTRIRENVRLAEAPSFGKAILDFAPSFHGSEDYQKLTREIIRQEEHV